MSAPMFGQLRLAVLSISEHIAQDGYARFPGLLNSDETTGLLEPTWAAPWVKLPHRVGQVRQDAEELVFTTLGRGPQRDFVDSIAVSPLVPARNTSELTYMRYPDGLGGISAHRDQSRYVGILAVASLSGQARFRIHGIADRDVVHATWEASPGEVVIMAGGPWRALPIDARAMHSITTSGGQPRVSLTVRFLTQKSEPSF